MTEVKIGKAAALAAIRERCAMTTPGEAGAPLHVEHCVPVGLSLFVRHVADGSLHPCTRLDNGIVQWRHSAVGDGAALVIAPAEGREHAAKSFAEELSEAGYRNVTISQEVEVRT